MKMHVMSYVSCKLKTSSTGKIVSKDENGIVFIIGLLGWNMCYWFVSLYFFMQWLRFS